MWALAGLLFALPCHAGTIVRNNGPAKLEVRFEPEEPHLTLADVITVAITIETSAVERVEWPREWPAAAKWLLVEPGKPVRQGISPNRFRHQQIYQFAPREPRDKGTVLFVFPDILIRDGDREPRTIRWNPIEFTVTTKITQPDLAALRGTPDIEPLPPVSPPPEETSWLVWLLAASLLLVAVLLIVLRHVFHRKRLRSPQARALYECQRLIAMRLPESGRSERFITLLTMLLRDYLERGCQLPARRQTTHEFLRSCAEEPSLTDQEKQFLTEFLEHCDAVKFAQGTMTVEECHAWADKVRLFLVHHEGAASQAPP